MVGKKKICYSNSSLRRTVTVTTASPPTIDFTNAKSIVEVKKKVKEQTFIHPAPLPVYIPRPRMDQPGLVGGLGPPMPIPVPPKGSKNDDFYKYWDRFTRVKEKNDAPKLKTGKKVIAKGVKNGVSKAEAEVKTKADENTTRGREGPSLDKDVEGRPGHPMVRSNTEGVISR
jgi:hypothetical protein